jgi:hypothetical protein
MKTVLMLIAITALSATAWAENFSGHWALDMPGRGGQAQKMSLELNQKGNVVTGTLSAVRDAGSASPVNNAIWAGRVDGNTITFYVWHGSDKPWKETFKGTLSGDQITFTVTDAAHETINFSGPARSETVPETNIQVTAKQSD